MKIANVILCGAGLVCLASCQSGGSHATAADQASQPAFRNAIASGATFWVLNFGNQSISKYRAGVGGNLRPIAVLRGPHTGLSHLAGIAEDRGGRLYALSQHVDEARSVITVYPAASHGDQRPTDTIALDAEAVGLAEGMTVAGTGDLIVQTMRPVLQKQKQGLPKLRFEANLYDYGTVRAWKRRPIRIASVASAVPAELVLSGAFRTVMAVDGRGRVFTALPLQLDDEAGGVVYGSGVGVVPLGRSEQAQPSASIRLPGTSSFRQTATSPVGKDRRFVVTWHAVSVFGVAVDHSGRVLLLRSQSTGASRSRVHVIAEGRPKITTEVLRDAGSADVVAYDYLGQPDPPMSPLLDLSGSGIGPLSSTTGLAVDRDDDVYVSDGPHDAILEYAAGSSATSKASVVVRGSATGLARPGPLAMPPP